jgi:hypothetical protein
MIFEQFYLECLSHASYLVGDQSTGIAASVLRANGFRDVSDVLGGFEAILQVQN